MVEKGNRAYNRSGNGDEYRKRNLVCQSEEMDESVDNQDDLSRAKLGGSWEAPIEGKGGASG